MWWAVCVRVVPRLLVCPQCDAREGSAGMVSWAGNAVAHEAQIEGGEKAGQTRARAWVCVRRVCVCVEQEGRHEARTHTWSHTRGKTHKPQQYK